VREITSEEVVFATEVVELAVLLRRTTVGVVMVFVVFVVAVAVFLAVVFLGITLSKLLQF
jgi:hypothetical protein